MGIRIVPEFDIPGHSKGFEPLAWGAKPDILFCGELPDVNQLYDDPAGTAERLAFWRYFLCETRDRLPRQARDKRKERLRARVCLRRRHIQDAARNHGRNGGE
jgi:hypothetical protein